MLGRPYGSPGDIPRLTVLEARGPRPRGGQSRPLRGSGRRLFHASPLSARGLLVITGTPWLLDAPPQSLPSPLHGVLPVCLSVSRFFFFKDTTHIKLGPPKLSGKEGPPIRRLRFSPWARQIPWRGKWQPTPVFLPGKSHGQKSLVGYSSRSCKELDTT